MYIYIYINFFFHPSRKSSINYFPVCVQADCKATAATSAAAAQDQPPPAADPGQSVNFCRPCNTQTKPSPLEIIIIIFITIFKKKNK